MAWVTVNFNAQGGTLNSQTPLYFNNSGTYLGWYTAKNTGSAYRITSITPPTRSNYIFGGFWSGTGGTGTRCVSASGSLGFPPGTSSSYTIYAAWRDYYIISLDNGEYGSGAAAIYWKLNGGGFYSDTALSNPITSIDPPTGGGTFAGYYSGGVLMIDAAGNFTAAMLAAEVAADATYTASWRGGAVDYFGLASSALLPIASDSGETMEHTAPTHYGKHTSGVSATGGVWRNPSTTYAVKASTTVAVRLGKAFAATLSGTTMTRSGYMITAVTIETAVGSFPTVTVAATANEGANAINLFDISVPVVARSKAQNLLSAVSGGGELQRVLLTASAQPVVCVENQMPCASDIVAPAYEIAADTLAPSGESAPEAANGFTLVGKPRAGADIGFVTYSAALRKEIV